jgi:lysophospholipase L1-like esterase
MIFQFLLNAWFNRMKENGFISWASLAGLVLILSAGKIFAEDQEPKPVDPYFAQFEPLKAPEPGDLLLKPGDELAIIGDSITEQKMYSRIIETYLTVCTPQLKISTRQYGWSGETAEGFLYRMTNDCLRFRPTIATLCYGMNDHRYRAYDEGNALWYSNRYSSVVGALKSIGARVVLGSPGCVGKVAPWAISNHATVEEMNLNLERFRNIDIHLAAQNQVRFADVFWPLFTGAFKARQEFGPDYGLTGKDGVHPNWAGHLVMAYAFLKAMGLNGELGTFTVDLSAQTAVATEGHTVDGFTNNVLTITSRRYPFCAAGAVEQDNSIRSGMALVPFNRTLNRLMLIVTGCTAKNYAITWGTETHIYTPAQLAAGINLADDFVTNPFSEPFGKVAAAVYAKQTYETRQIKDLFHGPEGKIDPDGTANLTEEARKPLVEAIAAAFVPVTHNLAIAPVPAP